jgi:hypothetical protein
MPRGKPHSADVYIARESFVARVGDEEVWVSAGETRVRAGHALLARYAHAFKPADEDIHFEVEQATAAPGEKRGAPYPPGDPRAA